MTAPTLTPDLRLLRLAVAPIRSSRVAGQADGQTGDGAITIEGYAAVFEQETVLYDSKWARISEVISRGAFDSVLERVSAGDELVHLNHGHDMTSAVAASNVDSRRVGGLELRADHRGLRFFARVDPEDPDAARMATKMRNGVISQASFAFTIANEECRSRELSDGRSEELWRILEIGQLYDVCVCAQGAYPQTESSIRTLAATSTRLPALKLEPPASPSSLTLLRTKARHPRRSVSPDVGIS